MGVYRSGELARLSGVSPDTLRHYERKGILRPNRAANGYRQYPESAVERVRLVQRALGLGFSLDELAKIFGERDRGGAPCQEVRALAGRKLEQARVRLAELETLCSRLEALVREWDSMLAETLPGNRAELLRTLPENTPAGRPRMAKRGVQIESSRPRPERPGSKGETE